jgi:hypothetical protein
LVILGIGPTRLLSDGILKPFDHKVINHNVLQSAWYRPKTFIPWLTNRRRNESRTTSSLKTLAISPYSCNAEESGVHVKVAGARKLSAMAANQPAHSANHPDRNALGFKPKTGRL